MGNTLFPGKVKIRGRECKQSSNYPLFVRINKIFPRAPKVIMCFALVIAAILKSSFSNYLKFSGNLQTRNCALCFVCLIMYPYIPYHVSLHVIQCIPTCHTMYSYMPYRVFQCVTQCIPTCHTYIPHIIVCIINTNCLLKDSEILLQNFHRLICKNLYPLISPYSYRASITIVISFTIVSLYFLRFTVISLGLNRCR